MPMLFDGLFLIGVVFAFAVFSAALAYASRVGKRTSGSSHPAH
jgi:hypothetical protein